jgi:endoglucanase
MPAKHFRFVSSLIVVALMAGLFLGVSQPVRAETKGPLAPPEIPGEVVYVPFPVAITLDGKLDDWQNIPVQVVVKRSASDSVPGEDGPLSFAVAADNENFYLTMTMVDKTIITGQHEANFWNEDSLEFYLNTSGDLNAAAYADGVFQVNLNPGNIGNTDPTSLTLTGTNAAQAQVRAFVFKTADGWGFEAALPLKLKPEHGLEIGFQAQANGASKKDRNVKLIWSNADVADSSWRSPYLFGRALFFEVGRADIPTSSGRTAAPTTVPTATPTTSRQQISVNQVGYYTQAAKIAALASKRKAAVEWALKDGSGKTVLTGKAEVMKEDGASGDVVQRIDFSAYTVPGKGYTLEADGRVSDPFEIGETIYSNLKLDALRYFYLNRSGMDLEQKFAGDWARPAGHLSDSKVTCYTGADSAGKIWPKCDYTLDASRGWYDAGDYGKYVVNGGISVWTLLNAYERNPSAFADGVLNIPESGNSVPDILDEARFEMEFLLGMQVPEGQPLAGMAHHKLHGLQWDAMPALPPAESTTRFLFPPSTAATLNLAATAAQCARIWKDLDADFSARCLKAAETAWQAANAHPEMLAAEFPELGGGAYGDKNISDEFYWAAAELSLTTGKQEYQQSYTTSADNLSSKTMSWADTAALGTVSLAVVGKDAAARESVAKAADDVIANMQKKSNGYLSPLQSNNYQWGSNADALNRAILLALAHDFTGEARYLDAAAEVMNTILGRNTLNFSFVSGYGTQSLAHPHHRFWGNQPADGFPPPPPGVVAGGPNGNPSDPAATTALLVGKPPAKSYIDEIGSFSTNEVTINWNAPLAWLAAYLDDTARPTLTGQKPAATPTPVADSAPAPISEPQSQPGSSWIAILGGVLALGLAGVVVLLWRRRRA